MWCDIGQVQIVIIVVVSNNYRLNIFELWEVGVNLLGITLYLSKCDFGEGEIGKKGIGQNILTIK